MLGKSATRFLKAQYRNQTGIYKTIYLFTYLFIHSFLFNFKQSKQRFTKDNLVGDTKHRSDSKSLV